jgi:hypothetical protein
LCDPIHRFMASRQSCAGTVTSDVDADPMIDTPEWAMTPPGEATPAVGSSRSIPSSVAEGRRRAFAPGAA